MSAFSRLQLAAALLEYDNDPTNPDAPHRSAHDSAIFAHLRRNAPRPAAMSRKSTDYLSVALPTDAGSVVGRESVAETRRSRQSLDALRNPFSQTGEVEEPEEEEEDEDENLDIDLASWGLDAFVPKEKGSKSSRKSKIAPLPNPHPARVQPGYAEEVHGRSSLSKRSMSLSGYDNFGEGGAFLDAGSSPPPHPPHDTQRRHSVGSALDEMPIASPRPMHGRQSSGHVLIENIPVTPPLHSVPFPSRSPPPSVLNEFGGPGDADFSIRPPSPDRASRFDPKSAGHSRVVSNATMGTMTSKALLGDENNPFSVRPPSTTRSSRFDPKVANRGRTTSNGSLGTQMLLDNESVADQEYGRERRYSKWDLMRPKVLVMPSPLQGTVSTAPPTQEKGRDGFMLSTDGTPLPPGARSARRSAVLSTIQPLAPVASNAFTPNPRASLTLSQLTFRQTLMVDGQRDVAYADIDEDLPRATTEGEQIRAPSPVVEEPPPPPVPVVQIVEEPADDAPRRPAGKLFGKSLIDDLEARKAEMRGKQRTFRGDDRPSMMARNPMQRSSTLVDPTELRVRPPTQHVDSFGSQKSAPELARRNSAGPKPLLNFDDDGKLAANRLGVEARSPKSRSVFGVDTIWEREMARLKDIEARERLEEEVRRKREEEEDARNPRKKKGKDKKNQKAISEHSPSPVAPSPSPSPILPTAASPPMLPDIQKASTRRAPPPPMDDDDDEEESGSDSGQDAPAPGSRLSGKQPSNKGWSSDEDEKGPIRTTGRGPRYPNRPRGNLGIVQIPDGESSDEDIPLAAAVSRLTMKPPSQFAPQSDSEEEDKPLSALINNKSLSLPGIRSSTPLLGDNLGVPTREDDDDKPLGLRVSRIASPSIHGGQVDDDTPLAFHPEQQRRTQYQMMAQQQQAMMMQAQMHNSMFMGGPPSMMSPGFFGGPMTPGMMLPPPPMVMASPAPANDSAKYGRVDKWRHDVAVEGVP
ncbi:hypothetical protein JAAARDRAFT_118289 [Jaapia argillacea MUCL 33604]|uniref:Uncharacterized protein n=1 Tax=Jaapia argillacea MUCL 33604 TaxID=933084 RepID=A0A067QLW2_9AGAM|nr:hypothetical protein JAAARDRAFT_118289 [Jaapia argillacea MUCL 33604]